MGSRCPLRSPVAHKGAIGGAASAALTPDFIKAIDPAGAALDSGQRAALAGFSTLLGGLAAGLAGQDAQAGALAAQNEALNNSGDHREDAAKKGGLLSAFGSWLQNTYGDPLGDLSRWGNQFLGLMQSGARQKMSESPSALLARGVANGVNAVAGSGGGRPPAAGPDVVTVSSGAGQVTSSTTVRTPPNATLTSGNGGDTSSGSDDVSLASSDRTNHILNGDSTGGGICGRALREIGLPIRLVCIADNECGGQAGRKMGMES